MATAAFAVVEPPAKSRLFSLDEQTWVLFYDLPSRRFRSIRDAFIRRDFASATNELLVSAAFVRSESERATAALAVPLSEVIARMTSIADTMEQGGSTVSDLDAVFARTHWLLAQHYLVLAQQARLDGQHDFAGHYLWATAHHMERTALWSDARLTTALVRDIERLRSMANELRTSKKPDKVYRNRPLKSASETLVALGEFLDRKVWVSVPTT